VEILEILPLIGAKKGAIALPECERCAPVKRASYLA
jgi:hypothetical protein